MANLDSMERIWYNQGKYEAAECKFAEHVASEHASLVVEGVGVRVDPESSGPASSPPKQQQHRSGRPADSIKKMTNLIGESLKSATPLSSAKPKQSPELERRVKALEMENKLLKGMLREMDRRLIALEETSQSRGVINEAESQDGPSTAAKRAGDDDDDDDDFDLFGPDEDDDDKTQESVKPAKPVKKMPIAKSSIVLEVKPWDDETDMKEIESKVRGIYTDGLLWGASKLVPVGYGIHKLQISCIVEDEKVGTDFLEEEICKFADIVQSVDVAAFNKL